MKRQCKDCEFKEGEYCKRYPPTTFNNEEYISGFLQTYPEVEDDDWCGEYSSQIRISK